MSFFTDKKFSRKIKLILLIAIALVFIFPSIVRADDGVGGKLLTPIVDFIVTLGDAVMNVLHSIIYNQDKAIVSVSLTSGLWKFVLLVAVFAAVAFATGAGVVALSSKIIALVGHFGIELASIGVGTVLMVSTGTGLVATGLFNANILPDDLVLPVFKVAPEEIFSGNLAMFDINFFNPHEDNSTDNKVVTQEIKVTEANAQEMLDTYGYNSEAALNKQAQDGTPGADRYYTSHKYSWSIMGDDELTTDYVMEYYERTNANSDVPEGKLTIARNSKTESTAKQLRGVISSWYRAIRTIALVGLLSVLVYVGIRIIISTTSNDKAKYKNMLVDWLVAICLLFVIHYIMVFSVALVEKITDLVSSMNNENEYVAVIADKNGKLSEALEKEGFGSKEELKKRETLIEIQGEDYIQWKTNLTGMARLNAQMARDENSGYAGYALIYCVLVLYTLFFTFTYLKRVLYMAFLTLMAPLVTLTYPIDKMNDGKAQAFNSWFREYMFNLLIQPLHLLLYTILVTSAFELAANNMIYALVALGFLTPAEKLLRKFFGFSKAETPGVFGGAVGAGMVMSGLNKMLHKRPSRRNGEPNKGGSAKGSGDEDNKPPRTADFDTSEEFANSNKGSQPMIASSGKSKIGANVSTPGSGNKKVGSGSNKGSQPMSAIAGQSRREANVSALGSGKKKAESKSNKSRLRGFKRATGAYIRNKASGKGLTAPIRGMAKLATGAAIGATAGLAGTALAVTSGDPSKVLSYGGGAAAAGFAFGGALSNGMSKALDDSSVRDEWEKGYYGDDYKAEKMKEYIKDYQNNARNRNKIEDKFGTQGKEKVKEVMEQSIPTFLNNGIIDMDDIVALQKLTDGGTFSDLNEAIAVKKMQSRIGTDSTSLSSKKRKEWEQTFKDEFGARYTNGDVLSKEAMKKIDRFCAERYK